jgi:hypothetical protein
VSYDEEFGQGRSKKSLNASWKILMIALIGLAIVSLIEELLK